MEDTENGDDYTEQVRQLQEMAGGPRTEAGAMLRACAGDMDNAATRLVQGLPPSLTSADENEQQAVPVERRETLAETK